MNEMPKTGVTDKSALRARYREPSDTVRRKELPALDKHARNFLAMSPFLCIATADAQGRADVSPRGDPPGFVRVLDDTTLLIPDRSGNNRLDTMQNILENPEVALIVFVPGVEETLRIEGRAEIVAGHPALAACEMNGKIPEVGILVHVRGAMLHCAKALKRAKLWDPATQIERKSFPTLGQMITDLGVTAEEADANLAKAYQKLY